MSSKTRSAVKAAEAEARAFMAAHPDITQVDALLADSCGVLRGKKLPIRGLPKLYGEGVGFPGSIYATDITGDTVEETGLGLDERFDLRGFRSGSLNEMIQLEVGAKVGH